MTDDYELGQAIAAAAGIRHPHRLDPVMLETVGSDMRPALVEMAVTLADIARLIAELPADTRARFWAAAEPTEEQP